MKDLDLKEGQAVEEEEASPKDVKELLDPQPQEVLASIEDSELSEYESGEVEDLEFLGTEEISSIIESLLFANDKPVSFKTIKDCFKGTQVKVSQVKKSIELLKVDYASPARGFTLEEVTNGYQLRTKADNLKYLKGAVKVKSFKLSGPALEVLSILAYKQPCIKHEVDEIRGVESGHLIRGLMERGLLTFAGKSELPGKPMYYATTRKFLEIFGLRNLNELPSLSEIDDLIPEGIGDELDKKESLGDVAEDLSQQTELTSYSSGEEELEAINTSLTSISTTTDFFEQEKIRLREERERLKAEDIQQAIELEEEVDDKDRRWLERYKSIKIEKEALSQAKEEKKQSEIDDAAIDSELDEKSMESISEIELENLVQYSDSEAAQDSIQNLSSTSMEEPTPASKSEKQIQEDLDIWLEE